MDTYHPDRRSASMARPDKIHRFDSLICSGQQQNLKVVFASRSYCTFHSYVFEQFRSFPKTPSHVRIYYTYIQISALLNLLHSLTSQTYFSSRICPSAIAYHYSHRHAHQWTIKELSDLYRLKKPQDDNKKR